MVKKKKKKYRNAEFVLCPLYTHIFFLWNFPNYLTNIFFFFNIFLFDFDNYSSSFIKKISVWKKVPGRLLGIRVVFNETPWDRLVLPYWWHVFAKVILLSTRGTAGLDMWFTHSVDRPLVRRYHPWD